MTRNSDQPDPVELWQTIASSAGFPPAHAQIVRMHRFLDFLLERNERLNLTRIIDREQALVMHIADAMTVLRLLPGTPCKVADIGSGGGVPGIPIAIMRPDVEMTLIEATGKKCEFLHECVRSLGLDNVRVLNARAEASREAGQVAPFDLVLARAVGTMPQLAQWCHKLLRPGGRLLAMKGPKATQEIAELALSPSKRGYSPPVVHDAGLPGRRHVIVELRRPGR
jgi:16S rRNA (guanine527-N7)-methyltransferase